MQAFKQAMLQLPPLSPLQVELLHTYHQQCIAELDEIVDWWSTHMQDDAGVFHGRMTHAGAIEPAAARGLVLYSRLLWTYSAAYSFRKKASDAATAHRLYQYLRQYFFDPQFGGFYWSVDCEGKCLNDRKQTYGQAFALYAISTYASTFQSEAATAFAMDIFACIATLYVTFKSICRISCRLVYTFPFALSMLHLQMMDYVTKICGR